METLDGKVSKKCGACGAENWKRPKPIPANAQKKQIDFLCDHCGVKNLRDGSISGIKREKVQVDPRQVVQTSESKKSEPQKADHPRPVPQVPSKKQGFINWLWND